LFLDKPEKSDHSLAGGLNLLKKIDPGFAHPGNL
ncbi:uncharacterized protein METZ01_LOCUS287052, partial [marine metagenome]